MDTSLQAFQEVQDKGVPADQVRVMLACLEEHGALTAQEISSLSPLDEHSTSRRRSVLLRCSLATEDPARTCKVSGRQAKPLRITLLGRRVLGGEDLPVMAPSKRDRELAVVKAARRLLDAVSREDHDAALTGLESAIHALDKRIPRPREPWGTRRRVEAARDGVWIRQDGTAVPVTEMTDWHLQGAIKYCQRNDATPDHPVLAALLAEERRRS